MRQARAAGMPSDQVRNFISAHYWPQPKQMLFHAAARACDHEDGPDQIGFGGARGPGKSHSSFAQVALDDCRRIPNLKVLYIRKVGKQAREQFEDLRRSVLKNVPHSYRRHEGILTLWQDSRIFIGSFRHEGEIDNYLGIEYDAILIEETTTFTQLKYTALRDSNRTSKKGWRPRVYTTTNPGNIGHAWYKRRFIEPYRRHKETFTRFIPATVYDNFHIDRGYQRKLEENTGWRRRAYLEGDWDIAAGQYFTEWRDHLHVIEPFKTPDHWNYYLAMDYGHAHPTVIQLHAHDNDGNVYVIDEHTQAKWLPDRHANSIRNMIKRHGIDPNVLKSVWAGGDVFVKKGKLSIADEYMKEGIYLREADMDRIQGAAEVSHRLGALPRDDEDPGRPPTLFVFNRCHSLIDCIPRMQHDPKKPEDVLKMDVDEDGNDGDDDYDCLRYGLMKARPKIRGATSSAPQDPVEAAKRKRKGRW